MSKILKMLVIWILMGIVYLAIKEVNNLTSFFV